LVRFYSASDITGQPAFSRRDLIVVVVLLLAGGALGLPALQRMSREARRTECLENLRTIGAAMSAYVEQNGRRWPHMAKLPSMEDHQPPWPGMAAVLKPFMGGQEGRLRCPSDVRVLGAESPLRKRFPEKTTYFETEGTSYEWVLQLLYAGQPVGRDPLARAEGLGMGPADQPIVWDFEPFHRHGSEPGSFNILYADFVARPERGQLAVPAGRGN